MAFNHQRNFAVTYRNLPSVRYSSWISTRHREHSPAQRSIPYNSFLLYQLSSTEYAWQGSPHLSVTYDCHAARRGNSATDLSAVSSVNSDSLHILVDIGFANRSNANE